MYNVIIQVSSGGSYWTKWTSDDKVASAQLQINTSLQSTLLHTKKYYIGWILLNVATMPKILCYLIKVSTLLSNIRFSTSFRCLEESTQQMTLDFET